MELEDEMKEDEIEEDEIREDEIKENGLEVIGSPPAILSNSQDTMGEEDVGYGSALHSQPERVDRNGLEAEIMEDQDSLERNEAVASAHTSSGPGAGVVVINLISDEESDDDDQPRRRRDMEMEIHTSVNGTETEELQEAKVWAGSPEANQPNEAEHAKATMRGGSVPSGGASSASHDSEQVRERGWPC